MKNLFGKSPVRTSTGSRLSRLRQLKMENLEGRRLMAADFSPYHNDLIAEDVNRDFRVSPSDALVVINMLNDRGRASGESPSLDDELKWDVSGDGYLSPIDALKIINRLNGEGENHHLMEYSFTVTNPATGALITTPVAVGSEFAVNVFVRDVRNMSTRPINNDGKVVGGVYSAAVDLGVSSLNLADYLFTTNFRSGIQYVAANFNLQREGFQGGGIQLGNGNVPSVSDGQTFSLTNSTGTVTFEFDSNSTLTGASNTRITLPGGNLTFASVANAMVTAINGSTLGITTRFSGNAVVILPSGVTFNAGTTTFSLSENSNEFFDEIRALSTSSFEPPDDPGLAKGFFTVRFRATAAGTLTFNPNAPESPSSENGVYSTSSEPNPAPTPLPNNLVNFGNPFTVQIIADPTGPRAVGDTLTTNEDVNLNIVRANLLTNDSSGATPPRTLSVTSIRTIAGTTLGTLAGDVYTPPSNVNGNAADFLAYTVTDSQGLTATATITINLTPVNDAPVAGDDNFNIVLGSEGNDLDVLDNDSPGPANESAQSLVITSVTQPGGTGGTVSIAPGGGSLIYTPNGAFVGTETFSYTVADNGNPSLTDTATVTVDVQPATLPFAVRDRVNALEDSTNNRFTVLTNDRVNAGQTAVLIGIASNPTNGTATIDAGTILYTPTRDFFGTDVFTYSMNESGGNGPNSIGTVTVTVANVNDVPVLVNDTAQAAENEVRNIPFADLLANDSKGPGEDAQTLTIASVAAVTAGAGTVAISGTNVVYTPAPGFSGQFLFTYQATDNGTPPATTTVPATVTVNVTPFNDPPVLQNDTATGTEDINVTIALQTLLDNDSPGPGETSGADTQTLSVTSVAAVTQNAGTVQIVGANVVYTPAANFNGPFTFTYTATDTGFPPKSATATVVVTMAAVNDPPAINGGGGATETVRGFKNNPLRIPYSQLLANDNAGAPNESGQVLSIVSVQNPVSGTVQLDAARSEVVFTPTAEFIGQASFQYTVRDNGGGTDTASGTVIVNVEEFQPSSIGGTVWIDETKDNVIGQVINGQVVRNERYLGGINVVLTGTSLGQAIAPQTATTLSDGTYRFEDLGPGSYQVTFDAPIYSGVESSFYTTNVFAINIPEPGGIDATRNYAVSGIDARSMTRLGRLMDQLVSRYHSDAGISLRGAYFAVAQDNSMMWGMKLDGFADALYTEAVLDGDNHLLVTMVDANRQLRTARVTNEFFSFVEDENGDMLVRLIGSIGNFDWRDTSLTNPAFNAPNYLESVDELFDQRGW